jgi:surfeit locus 1 family protein
VTAANSEYRHVQATGVFLNDSETLVQALTDLGAGFWVLTPLRLEDGTVVLVNRGFVSPEQRERAAHGAADATTPATVRGLLRITEPKGWFLRRNDPGRNLWYSRDVGAIAGARGLGVGRVAPYFIDREASAGGGANSAPVGGLTVIAFRNTHLTYAITWYGLALLVVVGVWIVIREERRRA